MLDFFKKLAEAFFEAFAKAVTDYPFTTALVLAGVGLYVHYRGNVLIFKNGKPRNDFSIGEIILLMFWFVVAIVLAFFVGYIFNAVISAIAWMFGFGQALVIPFRDSPVAFTVFIIIFLTIELAYFTYKTRFKLKTSPPGKVVALAFIALFATYVSTMIYIDLHKDSDKKTSSTSEK